MKSIKELIESKESAEGIVHSIIEQKYSPEQIAKFISTFANLENPGTRDIINVWSGPGGLTHTRGSTEFRDNKHEHIVTLELQNEFAPFSIADLVRMIKFKMGTR